MGITVQHGDNAYWGPHVFLEGSGEAEEIRGVYARESAGWPPLHFAIAEAKPEAGERMQVPGVTIRGGGAEEIQIALRPNHLIEEVQPASASYSSVAFEDGPHQADWDETLAADRTAYFVAEDDSSAVGHATIYADPIDAQALHLASTAVVVTNLAASRFWPARGFQLTHIRLVRRLPDL
jgi:hypothetical protein